MKLLSLLKSVLLMGCFSTLFWITATFRVSQEKILIYNNDPHSIRKREEYRHYEGQGISNLKIERKKLSIEQPGDSTYEMRGEYSEDDVFKPLEYIRPEEIWNIARMKEVTGVGSSGTFLTDGLVRSLNDTAPVILRLYQTLEIDLLEPSKVEEVLIVMHRSSRNQRRHCQITLLNPARAVVHKIEGSTPVGVLHWRNLNLESVRYVQVRQVARNGGIWNKECQRNHQHLLELEEIEVYGYQSSSLQAGSSDSPSRKATLITSGFLPRSPRRREELLGALLRNLRNPYIEGVHILFQECPWLPRQHPSGEAREAKKDDGGEGKGKRNQSLPDFEAGEAKVAGSLYLPAMSKPALFDHPKVTLTCMWNQPTYKDFFTLANQKYSGKLVILSNGDISFTDSLRHLSLDFQSPPPSAPAPSSSSSASPPSAPAPSSSSSSPSSSPSSSSSSSSSSPPSESSLPPSSPKARKAIILARWATNCPKLDVFAHEHRCWSNYLSYDSFVFQPPIPEALVNKTDYLMNRGKAEHQTAKILEEEFELYNPCLDLVSLHAHCSDVREWKTGDPRLDSVKSFLNFTSELFPASGFHTPFTEWGE